MHAPKIILPFQFALAMAGIREIVGPKHEPAIVGIHQRIFSWIKDDETPYCASTMSFWLWAAGYEDPKTVRARDFEEYGEDATDCPQIGRTIVVLSRGSNPSKGHVGFFCGYTADGKVVVYGANQSNRMQYSEYAASRVVALRDPVRVPFEKAKVDANLRGAELRKAMIDLAVSCKTGA